MYEDLLNCLKEEHANDKKIVFEYPESDIEETSPIPIQKKKIEKPQEVEIEEIKNEDDTEEIEDEPNEFEEDEESYEEDDYFEEPKRRNTLIIILTSFFLLLLIAAGIFWLITTKEIEDVLVPDVVGLTTDEAIEKLTKEGFTYTTEIKNSEEVEEGKVIKTNPKAGSTRKKGDTITIFESVGGEYYYLENYLNKNYTEVKAKLELLGIKVLIEKKDVEDKEKYKDKENIIIDQSPKFDEKSEKVLIEIGDTITLYIPNIVNEYPDMVNEGWTLNDAINFAKENKLTLSAEDSSGKTIPESEYEKYTSSVIIEQSRPASDAIIEGWNLTVTLNAKYEVEEEQETTENE